MDTEPLTIRRVANRTGVSSKTLRYWEEVGLLPKAARERKGQGLDFDDAPTQLVVGRFRVWPDDKLKTPVLSCPFG
jgi:hypothetical protein